MTGNIFVGILVTALTVLKGWDRQMKNQTHVSLIAGVFAVGTIVSIASLQPVTAKPHSRSFTTVTTHKITRERSETVFQVCHLIRGRITDLLGASSIILRSADSGPGLSHGPGVHSMAIRAGRAFTFNIKDAVYQNADGNKIQRPAIAVGDQLVVLTSGDQIDVRTPMQAYVIMKIDG